MSFSTVEIQLIISNDWNSKAKNIVFTYITYSCYLWWWLSVIAFFDRWCGPCKLLGPRLETKVGALNGKVLLAKVDVDDNADLAMEFMVNSLSSTAYGHLCSHFKNHMNLKAVHCLIKFPIFFQYICTCILFIMFCSISFTMHDTF